MTNDKAQMSNQAQSSNDKEMHDTRYRMQEYMTQDNT